jgi:5-carboxymethyl-2-hydroxymuconate isomerase
MPHTILEYSDNIVQPVDFQALWAELHPALAAAAGCRLQDIKSRAYCCGDFRMGSGSPTYAFIHLTVRMFEGRDPGTLGRVGEVLLAVLRAHFQATLERTQCDLTVELTGMRRDCYFKVSSCAG